MRILSFLVFVLILFQPALSRAQTTQEAQHQIQHSISDLKKQIADQEMLISEAKNNKEDADAIKSMEDQLTQLKQQLAMLENAAKSIGSIPSSIMNQAQKHVIAQNDNPVSVIPPKKTALLEELPKETLTSTQLQTFLNTFYTDLKKKISSEKVAAVQKIINQLENDPKKIAALGVAAWYNNAPAQAALLLTYAATKSPDANTLNNFGAVMNLCGHEEKAIPALQYVLSSHSNNSTVLNNLGQAYAGLGDKQTAMMYFARCIKQSPNHPEANATAAKIEESNGNMEQALEYTEASLRGAYNEERAEFFNKKKKSCSIRVPFNAEHVTKTKFFDPGGLHIPPNCRSWQESEDVYPLQKSYYEMIDGFFQTMQNKVLQNRVTEDDIIKMGESPFQKAAMFKKSVVIDCYTERKQELFEDRQEKLNKIIKDQQVEQLKLDEDYDKESRACPDNGKAECLDKVDYKYCKLKEALDNKYFGLLADVGDKYIQNNYTEDVGVYNALVYLEAISSVNEKALASTCGAYAINLLTQMKTYIISECNPADKPKCEQINPANPKNPNSPEFKEAQCPIGLKVKLNEALELNLSCSQFKMEVGVGEGAVNVKFGYEKDFITRESTLSMGPSVDGDIPGILDASASVKAFVKFDGNNQPIDAGISGEAEAGVKIGNTSTVGTTSMTSAGFTMGINSGFNYSGKSPF